MFVARAVAFYLPQFHPIPENDEWWEPGFTEWRNVARGRPLFPRHHQPHLPRELGFYDLRLPEVRAAQAALAAEAGIEAFCYWHYWFAGRRLLERPFADVLSSGEPRMKFCLAWANQTWTGVWHGAADRVLVEQTYPGPEDDAAHFRELIAAFGDDRYLTVDGRPLFYVFRPEELPDPAAFVDRWQAMATAAGLDGLFLVAEVSDLLGAGAKYKRWREDGFDAGVYVRMPVACSLLSTFRMRLTRKLLKWPEAWPHTDALPRPPEELDGPDLLPCVYPNWDNTPRAGRRGVVIRGSRPERFARQLGEALDRVRGNDSERRLVFIKSWNEWAEGNSLEPDEEWGRGWVDATAAVLRQ
jgi:hypothetical protein